MKLATLLILGLVVGSSAACGPKSYSDAVSRFRANARERPFLGTITASAVRGGKDRVPAKAVSADVSTAYPVHLESSGGTLCATIVQPGRNIQKSQSLADVDRKLAERRRSIVGVNFVTYPDYPATPEWPLATDGQQRVELSRRDVRRSDAFVDTYTAVITLCRPRPEIPPGTKLLALVFREEYYSPPANYVAFWEVEGAPAAPSTGGGAAPTDTPPVSNRRPSKEATGDILATLEADGGFSVFLGLLRDTDLPATLSTGEYTVFAFTDAYVARMGGARVFEETRKDRKQLQKYLSSVIAPGIYTEEQLRAETPVRDLMGSTIDYRVTSKGLSIQTLRIALPPIRATNGLIYAYPE